MLSVPRSVWKAPQKPNATPKHGRRSSSPFITARFLPLRPCLPVTGAPFKRTSLHFKSQQLPLQFLRLPHARTCTQLSAAQILCIPWPFLPPLPALTPPQPRAVEIIIFYACHSSPHTDKDYEIHTKLTCLQTCMSLSLRVSICAQPALVCSATAPLHANSVMQEHRSRRLGFNIRLTFPF